MTHSAGSTTSSLAAEGDPTMFPGVQASAEEDTSGNSLNLNNDGLADQADNDMLAQMLTDRVAGLAPAWAST